MTGYIIRQARITRADLRANPDRIYVFGDNMLRQGFGGQAREMRGELNAIGVPTKWSPHPEAYFVDHDLQNAHVRGAINSAFDRMRATLRDGYDVVIPTAGLGTGLADLARRAPAVLAYIEGKIRELEDAA